MTSKKRQKIRVFALCLAICLSLASFLTLRVIETRTGLTTEEDRVLAEEREFGEALPDVMLFKRLMNKTLEFILVAPRY